MMSNILNVRNVRVGVSIELQNNASTQTGGSERLIWHEQSIKIVLIYLYIRYLSQELKKEL